MISGSLANALALAARKRGWVPVHVRRRHADDIEKLASEGTVAIAWDHLVRAQGQLDGRPHGSFRIERRKGILLHDLDAAAQRAASLHLERCALEEDLSGGRPFETEDEVAERRLARTGLADDRHRLTAPDVEVDAGERVDAGPLDPVVLAQPAHAEHRCRAHGPASGSTQATRCPPPRSATGGGSRQTAWAWAQRG